MMKVDNDGRSVDVLITFLTVFIYVQLNILESRDMLDGIEKYSRP